MTTDEPRHDAAASTDGVIAGLGVGPGAADLSGDALELREGGRLARILHWIGVFEFAVGTLLIGVILVLVLMQVVQRYTPGSAGVWTGEIARFSLVWATLILSGYLLAQDRHITLEVIDYIVSPKRLVLIKRIAYVIVAFISLAMTFGAFALITERSGQVSPAARMPLTWVYVLPFLGFVLTTLRAVVACIAPSHHSPKLAAMAPEEGI